MQKINPKFSCDNLQDASITVLIAIIQISILFVLPSFLIYVLTGSESIAWLAFLSIYILFLSYSVFSISVGEEGIRFNRLFGTPKSLSWSEITAIESVSRKELIFKGWLWPLFPAKEMTFCLSSNGHYKIIYHGGYCYYPPANPENFIALISQYKSKAL